MTQGVGEDGGFGGIAHGDLFAVLQRNIAVGAQRRQPKKIRRGGAGRVVEVNDALEDKPELINQDAYENWIIKVSLSDKGELDNLMDAKAYAEFCEK